MTLRKLERNIRRVLGVFRSEIRDQIPELDKQLREWDH